MFREDGTYLPLLGAVNNAYVNERFERADVIHNIPIFKTVEASLENIPEVEEGTLYVVTTQVASYLKRPDLLTPFHAVRNSQGNIIGFRSLKSWA